jgi:pyrimidine operon attenuation protein/uracil phosphoribosyltransferase
MNDPDSILAQLTKAGAMVGISNLKWWLDLVIAHGPACVLAIVDEIHADTRQAVNVAVVAKRCDAEAKQKQDDADDAAADAAMQRQVARGGGVVPSVAKGAAAAVVSEPASVAAATDAYPISQSNPETFMNKADVKKLISQVDEEIARRGIHVTVAMSEVGVSATAIYNWRKGQIGNAAIEKINAWLSASAEATPMKPDVDESQAETVALEKKPKARATKPAQVEAAPVMDLSDLLTQGANLRDALNALGSTGYADVVQQFVDRLTTMRTALGG